MPRDDIPEDIRGLLDEAHDCLETADAINNNWLAEICERIETVLGEVPAIDPCYLKGRE